MAVQKFAVDAIAPTPWKNGGGATREIAVWPPGAAMESFAWRISVADIADDGPFSAFPGVDRQIALLEGAGVHLQAHDDSFSHRLVRVGEPFAFSGDTAMHATLIDGPTRDFNVMTRRGVCHADERLMRQPFSVVPGETTVLVLALDGAWEAGPSLHLAAGEGILLPAGTPAITLSHNGLAALCLRVTLHMERDR